MAYAKITHQTVLLCDESVLLNLLHVVWSKPFLDPSVHMVAACDVDEHVYILVLRPVQQHHASRLAVPERTPHIEPPPPQIHHCSSKVFYLLLVVAYLKFPFALSVAAEVKAEGGAP
jgi:hypothetical protein